MSTDRHAAAAPSAGKHVIIGTAGHIDHGKSSLIEALTGTHPDRLAEEKRRGITIDLGFAFLERGNTSLGFVDVPGHERFVRNMLAGAAGIDAVLLVIAADESIKPQTREHFEICRLLGVKRGMVALTKCDLVDADTLELARLEVEDYLRGSFLEGAPVISVSSKTGAGVGELRDALFALAGAVPGRDSAQFFRLPVDRSFTIKGFGTVVTGTLVSGSVAPGDEVELLPGGTRLRIRGVESGGRTEVRALAGQRTALNLPGIEHTAIRRGMTLAAPGRFRAARRIDVRLEWLASAPKLKESTPLHFHAGTAETLAVVQFFERRELPPGESVPAHFKLRDPIFLMPGDRFIVRQFSPVTTTGGGTVLDAQARRPLRRDTGRTRHLEILEAGDPTEILQSMTERSMQSLPMEEAVARTGWREERVQRAAEELVRGGRLQILQAATPRFTTRVRMLEAEARLMAVVSDFHSRNPLSAGITHADLRQQAGRRMDPAIFRAALESLATQGKLALEGELVKRAGSTVKLQPAEEVALSAIEEAFRKAGVAAPAAAEVLRSTAFDAKHAEKLLQMLLKNGALVRVSADLILHREALAAVREKLRQFKLARGERISVPAFKELAGVTRKYAIPLLEYLDRQRVTKRAGDERVIL